MKPPTWRAWLLAGVAGMVAVLGLAWAYIPEFPEGVGIAWTEFREWVADPNVNPADPPP